ncbi:hypothetical protein T484DRAFT_1828851, partial [Baffinella frigidus]
AKALPPTPEQGKFVAEESAAPLKGKVLPPTPEEGVFLTQESAAAAAPGKKATPLRIPRTPPHAAPGKKATPASPGHLLMCGHACLLGAMEAAPGKKATSASLGHLIMCGHACLLGAMEATPASPCHLLLCGPARLLGAMEATGKLVQKQDAKNWLSAWKDDFSSASTAAAEATSPVGGYVMRTHIMA